MSRPEHHPPAPPSLLLPMLLLATGIFFASQGLGYAVGGQPGARRALESVASALKPLEGLGSPELMLFIFVNNAVKAGAIIVLGVLAGAAPLIFLVTNGLVVGLAVYQVVVQKGVGYTLAGVLPHGVVELPALLVAAALGLELGAEGLQWLRRRPSRVRPRLRAALRTYWNWIAPALAVAAAIEVFITPAVLRRF